MFMLAALAVANVAHAAPSISKSVPKGWTEDVEKARAKAAGQGKFVFMAFSGSDWCGYCRRMDAEVFSQKDFIGPASKKYVLVMIDSPSNKSILSDLAAEQNPKLTSEYGVAGFPSMVITDSNGKTVRRTGGYVQGGPKAFFAKLDGIMAGIEWPKPAVGGAPVELSDLEALFIERKDECGGELKVNSRLETSRRPLTPLDESKCDMASVKDSLSKMAAELNMIGTGATAAHLKAVDGFIKQYSKAANVPKEEVLEPYIRLLFRRAHEASDPAIKKALDMKLAALKRQAKGGEDYIADEEDRLAPDWIKIDGMCSWSMPEKLEKGISDGKLDAKAAKSAAASVLRQKRKLYAAKAAIVAKAIALNESTTAAETRKHLKDLEGAIAACERIRTAAIGTFAYGRAEKQRIKANTCSDEIALLEAISSRTENETVKALIAARIAVLKKSVR